jgi:translation initiation factor eIF-2B subunit beta
MLKTDGADARERRVREWLSRWAVLAAQFDTVCTKLQRRQLRGSTAVAKIIVSLLRKVIGQSKGSERVVDVIDMLRGMGKLLVDSQPLEVVIGNMVRRVLFLLRDALRKRGGDAGEVEMADVRQAVIEEVSELLGEIQNVDEPIAEKAVEHIHASEVVLTYSHLQIAVAFLCAAAAKRKYDVYVAETAPGLEGHKAAKAIASEAGASGINVTVISDAAVFALMSRVHKVIIGAHAVMANGGLVVHAGGHAIALAAHHFRVPVVVVTGLHKLCPVYPHDQDSVNAFGDAASSLPMIEAGGAINDIDVVSPVFDYIPPQLVSLLITDTVMCAPSYVYRLLAECYSDEDRVLE